MKTSKREKRRRVVSSQSHRSTLRQHLKRKKKRCDQARQFRAAAGSPAAHPSRSLPRCIPLPFPRSPISSSSRVRRPPPTSRPVPTVIWPLRPRRLTIDVVLPKQQKRAEPASPSTDPRRQRAGRSAPRRLTVDLELFLPTSSSSTVCFVLESLDVVLAESTDCN
jgi:hypothetical protein